MGLHIIKVTNAAVALDMRDIGGLPFYADFCRSCGNGAAIGDVDVWTKYLQEVAP